MNIDLTAITLVQAFGLLAIVALLDVGAAYALSVSHGDFDLGAVGVWIQSHVLKRVFPIFSLAVLGHGVAQLNIPAIEPAWALGIVALTAYVLETVASIQRSFSDTESPADTSPVTPVA